MTVATAKGVNPASTDERIALLLAEGHAYAFVLERGQLGGWGKSEIAAVLTKMGWRLDASGRVPRDQRPAVTPGKPLVAVPSGLPASSRDLALDRARAGLPGVGQVPVPRPVVAPSARPVESLTIDELLGVAKRHKARKVNQLAERIEAAVLGLRTELEARRAADAAEAQRERELAELVAKLRALDAERARLAAAIVAKGGKVKGAPPAAKKAATELGPAEVAIKPAETVPGPGGRPIAHGTWGGFLAEKARGLEVCDACDEARATRGRS